MTSRQDPSVPGESAGGKRPVTLFGAVPETPRAATVDEEEATPEQSTEARIAKARARASRGETDRAVIRGQWERAQKDLVRVQVLREREAEQTQAKLAQLHEALQIAQEAGSRRSRSHRQQVRRGILMSVGAVAVLVAGVFGVMKFMRGAAQRAPVEASVVPLQGPETANQLPGPQGEFAQGIGRLSKAFSRFPSSEPEAIIRAVNLKSGSNVCAFAWKDGQPALQFGAAHRGGLSVAGSLTQCAQAVEQFR